MTFKQYLEKLFQRLTLEQDEAHDMLVLLGTGQANAAQMAAFMTVYLMRAITPNELAGFRTAMLDLCHRVELEHESMDVCGTGGDGKDTFNISTTAAFVVAGAGQLVAKHGNYGVSSICGSSTVMEALGYQFSNTVDTIKRQAAYANITFLHAPLFHPAMSFAGPVRQELGTKTFFNMLGPLVNPVLPKHQLSGVFNLDLARLYTYLLQKTDVNFGVIHGLDGYDEISLTGPAKYLSRGKETFISPADFAFETLNASILAANSTPKENAKRLIKILKNEAPASDKEVVVANAAVALLTSRKAETLLEAVDLATISIESGSAYQCLHRLLMTA